jgi:hypothetical protein
MTWRKPEPPRPAERRPWTPEQIRRARKVPLAPLLRRRGYPLRQRPGENFQVQDHQDLVIKDSYWVWPSRQLKGNAIDFFMLVECRSFHEAMEILAADDLEIEQ